MTAAAKEPGAVLITGAASGVGAAAAHAFARHGRPVVLGDVNEERLTAVAEEIRPRGVALAAHLDVRADSSVRALVRAGQERFGSYATICANAGVAFADTPLERTADDVIDDLLLVNLRGIVYTLRAALPHLCDGGSVILTSSTSGLLAHPGGSVYAATKIALIGLARSLSAELSSRQIRVNCICPGAVDTPLLRRLYSDTDLEEAAATNPLGRLAQPGDVADLMVFLTLPAARHINGVALRVDGGAGVQGLAW